MRPAKYNNSGTGVFTDLWADCFAGTDSRRSHSIAQKAAGIRVGWLEVCAPGPRRRISIFSGLTIGYAEGKNLIIEQRFADCQYGRMLWLATDLMQVPVDVIFTMGTRAARIAAQTVKTTPLVVYSCDPFLHVKNLARPGGNLTGVTCMTTEMMPKRLELLHEAIPTISRVMFLHDPEAAPNAFNLTQEAAPRLGMTMQAAHVTAAEELLPELAMIAKARPEALLVYPDVVLSSYPREGHPSNKGRANAGFFRKVSVIRDWGNCVVASRTGLHRQIPCLQGN
jgi:ABC transporter substrate binding protein